MTPQTITAALGFVLAVILRLHLAVHAAGVTLVVSVPWAFVACVATALVVLTILIVRNLSGFRIMARRA